MRLTVKGGLAGVIFAVGLVVCLISQTLKDTEKVKVILGNSMLLALKEGTVFSFKIRHNTRQG